MSYYSQFGEDNTKLVDLYNNYKGGNLSKEEFQKQFVSEFESYLVDVLCDIDSNNECKNITFDHLENIYNTLCILIGRSMSKKIIDDLENSIYEMECEHECYVSDYCNYLVGLVIDDIKLWLEFYDESKMKFNYGYSVYGEEEEEE